jgi:hypothetical protein
MLEPQGGVSIQIKGPILRPRAQVRPLVLGMSPHALGWVKPDGLGGPSQKEGTTNKGDSEVKGPCPGNVPHPWTLLILKHEAKVIMYSTSPWGGLKFWKGLLIGGWKFETIDW